MMKKELRKKSIESLQKLAQNAEEKKAKEKQILATFFASALWKEAKTIGLIRSVGFEFSTDGIFTRGFEEKKQLVVPKSLKDRRLIFYHVTPKTRYETSTFGVEEPLSDLEAPKDTIDLLIVPGLVFSSEGYRIGFGGGYYDRYLQDFSGNTCSLAFKEQLDDSWQPEPFDVPIMKLFTDN
ncbi:MULTISPECIES: 5-formyltetrahydrofolate cyclo-ligase [Enterococcus]|uniref:5-formyltetrahydrofolate cyclo-ligase n=1 Tax=Enterococcus TaxID=1350 RepID=UPI00065E57D4|nr:MULTISPECIES: 5-formyltetrahydrofolate cyclo-ligase [Enterococcus]KAF1304249.1 5-formyltetrahydrofolate cyclo-ligase [Enterococcus sp. JM9B]